jgi:hypothetical protein
MIRKQPYCVRFDPTSLLQSSFEFRKKFWFSSPQFQNAVPPESLLPTKVAQLSHCYSDGQNFCCIHNKPLEGQWGHNTIYGGRKEAQLTGNQQQVKGESRDAGEENKSRSAV